MATALASAPEQAQLVSVRSRNWIVNEVLPSTLATSGLHGIFDPQTLVSLSVEDDGLGEEIQVVWELEPGARLIEKVALPDPTGFDPPDRLDAFLDAVRWGAPSSADVRTIQAPFRSGIDIEDYQLDPVVRAIQMPSESEHDDKHGEMVEIVWTGPEPAETRFRHTELAILEVLDSATKRLTVVSYAVYRIPRIRESLVAAANRGVSIRLSVETRNWIQGQGEYDCLLALDDNVAWACSVYYWPQENRAKDDNGKIGILHVKCAVADGHRMFLSSANFTEYAFTINMELGLLVTGGDLPAQVERHFERLIESGTVIPV
jgi:phosphatidylserine/phosphatidylglycerophosphate/cardiolipin synthase-like enzyme